MVLYLGMVGVPWAGLFAIFIGRDLKRGYVTEKDGSLSYRREHPRLFWSKMIIWCVSALIPEISLLLFR